MLKMNTVVSILAPSQIITSKEHQAFKLFEPAYFTERSVDKHEEAMVVAKTCVEDGSLYYLVCTKEQEHFIAPASAVEMTQPATKEEFLQWFFDTYQGHVDNDPVMNFVFTTGKNAPTLNHEIAEPVPAPEQETAIAIEEAAETESEPMPAENEPENTQAPE